MSVMSIRRQAERCRDRAGAPVAGCDRIVFSLPPLMYSLPDSSGYRFLISKKLA